MLCIFRSGDDEAFLVTKLSDGSYGDMIGSLGFTQVAPFGFLWVEVTSIKLFGFNEYALRLPSFICGVGGLFLFRHVAGRLLRGVPLIMAVAMFAVSYPMIRYTAEAKPYGLDLFFSLVILALVVEWWYRRMRQTRWLWLLALLIGPIMICSYPMCFVGGGVSLFIAWMLLFYRAPVDDAALSWNVASSDTVTETPASSNDGSAHFGSTNPSSKFFRSRSAASSGSAADGILAFIWRHLKSSFSAWIIFNVLLLAGFGTVFLLSIVPQSHSELSDMKGYWQNGFVPIDHPAEIPLWLLKAHCGAMMAYPVGGPNFGSSVTALLGFVGLVVLIVHRRIRMLALLLLPLALTLVASILQRYPYGEMVRFNIYMAPAFCLLAGIAIATIIGPWRESMRSTARPFVWGVAILLILIARRFNSS